MHQWNCPLEHHSLNDQLLVGPTVHLSLVDVLLRFHQHRIALTTDVSGMYRAVLLPDEQCDLHRFVLRQNPQEALNDYCMTRLTFGVSGSSFAANMSVKQNSMNFAKEHPKAASIVPISFYWWPDKWGLGWKGNETPESASSTVRSSRILSSKVDV